MNTVSACELVTALFSLKLSVSNDKAGQLLSQSARGLTANTGTGGTGGDEDETAHPDPGAGTGN